MCSRARTCVCFAHVYLSCVAHAKLRNLRVGQVAVSALVQRAVVTGNLATSSVNISVPEELVRLGSAAVAHNVGSRGCASELGGAPRKLAHARARANTR